MKNQGNTMKFYRILILTFFAYTLISCGGADERKSVYMEKAKASIEAGDLDKARIELKNVLQIDPKNGEAYYQIGTVYEQQKDYRQAYGNYLKAEELSPELLANHAKLGRFYLFLMNDEDKAQEKIGLILSKEPANSDGLLLKAAVELRHKNVKEAIKIAEDIIARDFTHAESVIFLAILYKKDKKVAEAISLLDASLKKNQHNEQLNKLLASTLVANKDYERAEVIYKAYLERNPNSRSSYNNLAAFYHQAGDTGKAEHMLRASIKNKPDDVDRYFRLITYISKIKSNEEALNQLKKSVSENMKLGKLRISLGEFYYLNGMKNEAVEVYEKVIQYFPEEVHGINARTALASIYINSKEYDKASKIVDEAISISPNDPKINFLRAKFAVMDKNMEEAIIALRIVTKEMPENIDAYLLLANIYQKEGNKGQVSSTLNTAYEKNKTNADALFKLAQIYLSQDIGQAENIIDNYNAIKGVDYDGLSIKASILNKNKKHTEANEVANILLENYPDKPNGYLQSVAYLLQNKDKESAISLLEKGYLNVKDNRKLLMLLTTLQAEDKKMDVVESRIKAELAVSPNDVELKILLAKVYMVNNNTDTAEKLLNEAVASKVDIEEPYLLLSQLYLSKKDTEAFKAILVQGTTNIKRSLKIPLKLASFLEAERSFSEVITIYRNMYEEHSDNLVVVNNLASMLSDHGDGKDDLQLANTLVEKLKKSNQPVFLDTIGWVYYKLADYNSAIQYLSQVIEKSPEVNVFNYHLGMAYKMSGDNVKAKIHLEKSLAGDKPFKEKELAAAALREF